MTQLPLRRLHGQDNSQIKSYYVSFWNGVDLRYKLLKGPRVKISIAGIIISRVRSVAGRGKAGQGGATRYRQNESLKLVYEILLEGD